MINVINAFGHSFAGLTDYLTHDKDRQDTSERVAWTHCHNLATQDPEKARRVMAATAMSQADLKREAGIKNTGRKSNAHVLHYVLSWSVEEHGQVSREEMMSAALSSLSYIGATEGEKLGRNRVAKRTQYADEHQALIVCHDDGPGTNPHVHLMVNRVHPQHGVFVSDSKDYDRLSRWALEYRKAQGKEHLCPARVINAAKRAKGLKTSNRRIPDSVYLDQQAADQAPENSAEQARLQHLTRRAKRLKSEKVALDRKYGQQRHQIDERFLREEKTIHSETRVKARASRMAARQSFTPRIETLAARQLEERLAFEEARGTAAGRVRNVWAAFKTRDWMHDLRTTRLHAVTTAFRLAFDSGLQAEQLASFHRSEHRSLNGEINQAERTASRVVRDDGEVQLDQLRTGYASAAGDLRLAQAMEEARIRAELVQLSADRSMILADLEAKRELGRDQDQDDQGSSGGSGKSPAPKTKLKEAARPSTKPGLDKGMPPSDPDRKSKLKNNRERVRRQRRDRGQRRDPRDRGQGPDGTSR